MSHMPPMLNTRPTPVKVILAVAVPALLGVLAGYMLGVSEPVYAVFALLGVAGAYFAGLEHDGARGGLLRGIVGGSLFGLFILLAHGFFFDAAPKAHIPAPAIHIAITTAFGMAFGALGGRRRAKHERNQTVHTDTTTTARETVNA